MIHKVATAKRGGDADKAENGQDTREHVDGVPRLLVLAKAERILDTFSIEEPELSVTEIVARTGLPVSTCIRIVRNLAHDGLLERVGDRYRIGLAIVRWASSALESRSLIANATPSLDWLRDETGESALLCIRDGRFAVVVAIANSHHAVVRQLHIGEVAPLHAGSRGKVFLAFDPDAPGVEDRELESFTKSTITRPDELAADIERIRRAGYAISVEERNEGVAGLSVPIFDKARRMVGSIGLTGPVTRLGPETMQNHASLALDAAAQISSRFGGRST
jgi:IclR family transcriptional regulator, acetate operon repressor